VGDCGTVLVIDCDSAFRALAEEHLGRAGYVTLPAASGEEAIALLDGDPPVLAIVEVELPGLNGLALLRELHQTFGTELPIFLVSERHQTPIDRTAGLLLGADDYLGKPLDAAELVARVRRSLRRSGASAANGDGRNGLQLHLSPREREILSLLAEGQSQKHIAATLVISPKTVATHIQHVLAKLGVHSRAEAVAAAYRRGLIEPDVRAHTLVEALVPVD